jgi:Tfp pilus assembly protein PilO
MAISDRDKRAIKVLGFTAVPALALLLWPSGDDSTAATASVPAAANNTPAALELQLHRLRRKQAELPVKANIAKDLNSQLALREKGLIRADTLAQAQAQMAQLVRQTGRAQGIDFRAVSMGTPRIHGNEYGEIVLTAAAECKVEQVVNFLAELTKLPELVATEDLRITANGDPKTKNLNFQVTVAGLVPKSLVPEKKGGSL